MTEIIKIKVTPKSTVKGKMDVRFPASVSVSSPLTLGLTGGNYLFGLSVTDLRLSLDTVYAPIGSGVSASTVDTTLTWKYSGTTVGTEAVANPAATSPTNSYVTTWQGTAAGGTTSLHVFPASGTLPTGTITEYVMGTTAAQAFGGNYGRWSLSNSGSGLAYVAGLFGEYGGTTATGAMGPFVFQIGIENPPATFTSYEYMRLQTKDGGSEDAQVGAVLFGANQPNPGTQQNRISIIKPNIGSAGQRDSDAILWEGKANNGTERAVWWRQYADVTSNAGASSFTWQSNLNGLGWNTRATLSDAGALTVTSLVGTTTNDSASAGNIGEFQASGLLTGVPDAAPSTGAPNVTVTMTIASPAVVTWTAHGLSGVTPVVFTTTGALPTGITAGTTYWTIPGSITTNTFQVATSIANALAGTAVNTTGSQSGTHTGANFFALTTNVPVNIAAISLTAGDWDVNGAINIMGAAATTVSYFTGSPGLTTATLNQSPSSSFAQTYAGGTPFATLTWVTNVLPVTRFSLASTTTIFLVVQAGFGVSTLSGNGIIRARRVR